MTSSTLLVLSSIASGPVTTETENVYSANTVTVNIPTVDDATLTNTYRVAKITLANISTNDYIINSSLSESFIILEDNNVCPSNWEGALEVYVKPHPQAHFEPLYDEKGVIVSFFFGRDDNNETTLRSYAVDDLPIAEFRIQPTQGVAATDPSGLNDLTVGIPLYKAIMQTGRRA